MRSFSIASIAVLSAVPVLGQRVDATGQLGNASVVTNNPIGKRAHANLPSAPFFTTGSLDGNVRGSVTVQSSSNGIGVDYVIELTNFPSDGGPFLYHVHEKKVPDNGNCTATAAHLDPYERGETPACDKEYPQTCQVGDLSGKQIPITRDPFELKFHDEFGSMSRGSNASVLDRSFVVHFANKTRITCANFVVDGDATTSPEPTSSMAPMPTTPAGNVTGGGPKPGNVTAGATALEAGLLVTAPLAAALVFML